jgi:hypothetical protein
MAPAREADGLQGRGDGYRRIIAEAEREEAEDPYAKLPNRICAACGEGFRVARGSPENRCPACVAADRKPPSPPSQYENWTGRTDEAWDRHHRGGR